MTHEQIVLRMEASPFRRFVLCLADGRVVPVWSADCLSIDSAGRILSLYLPPSNETEIVDLLLIVSLRFREPGAAEFAESTN